MSDQNWETLIDFSKIPSGCITGLEGNQVVKLAKQTMSKTEDDFPNLDDAIIEELNRSEDLLKNKFTSSQTDRYANMFESFLKEHNLSVDLKNMPDLILNDYLRYFYSKLKTKDDAYYSPSTSYYALEAPLIDI